MKIMKRLQKSEIKLKNYYKKTLQHGLFFGHFIFLCNNLFRKYKIVNMAISGEFRVEIPKNSLRNMETETMGYIFSNDFVLSKSLLCIPLDTEVIYNIEDILALNDGNYIGVYKLEDGLLPDSFDLNLEEDPNFDVKDWYLAPGSVTENYSKSNDWICFKNPPIFYDEVSYEEEFSATFSHEEIDELKEFSLENLQKMLDKAVGNEDYEKAAKIRDEIAKR